MKIIDETVVQKKLGNGLELFIIPKTGFYKVAINFTVQFGSINNHLKIENKERSFPNGIAHFLEHQMFEKKNRNLHQEFSEKGAFVNAYTNFLYTSYTLSTTSKIEEILPLFLDFVQEPSFTEETITRERKVIEQEIRMKKSDIEWIAYFSILNSMYQNHPVKNEIGGTFSSINEINMKMLYECHNVFYHPNNSKLCIVGDVDSERLIGQLKSNQELRKFEKPKEIQNLLNEDTRDVNTVYKEIFLPVQVKKFFVGYKLSKSIFQSDQSIKKEMIINVLLQMMFGKSSKIRKKLYESGKIDDSFVFNTTIDNKFGFIIISGNSYVPDEVTTIIHSSFCELQNSFIDSNELNRAIKVEIGKIIRSLDSPQYIANQYLRYKFRGGDLLVLPQILKSITVDDITSILFTCFKDQAKCVLIVKNDNSS
ncbi:EF-P 5-aminopentanol modification-associated protein YfmH [Enterococcus casseliflavus]|uniref:EF-P 5-aminopentanol modification-associated protein YfmH n=1 Tax=Enterococcus casseliflavus TaxID=37734 RepID=UPI0018845361|nr:pitrilysin family protein [Enterococcus casseliflavus]MBE9908969.1 insulinase family protein [Enterococcus casseliflavus]